MTAVQNAHNGVHLSAGQYCITNIAWDQAIAPLTPRTALACTPIFIKRKMSKGCQNRGCKKLARHPSIFCAFHTVLEVPVVPLERKKSPASSSSINSLLPCRKQKTFAYCQKYSLSHCDHQRCLEAIQSVVSDLLSSVNCRDTVGVRRLVPLPSPVLENIMPFLIRGKCQHCDHWKLTISYSWIGWRSQLWRKGVTLGGAKTADEWAEKYAVMSSIYAITLKNRKGSWHEHWWSKLGQFEQNVCGGREGNPWLGEEKKSTQMGNSCSEAS